MSDKPHIPDGHFEEEPIPAPCPHCGNTWSKTLYKDNPGGIERVYFVRCERCGARGPEKCANQYNSQECEETLKRAIREWNHRCHRCTDRAKAETHKTILRATAWLDHPATKALLEQLDIIHEASRPVKAMSALEKAYDNHGRATNVDEVDVLPGIQWDTEDRSLYHMYAAYADIRVGDYTVCIDTSYEGELHLGLHKWNGDHSETCFELCHPIPDKE